MREFDTTALQRTREPGGRAGFTLVELLVTLIILSTGIVLVLQAFETSAIALSESRDAMRADWLIRQKLAAMTADPGGDEAGGGSFPPPYNAYQWRASRHAIDRNGYSLEHLTVSVWRQDSKAIYAESTLVRKED
jgi:prepilin-type N-terminal cleavage/methylation domain-containing protein